MFVRVSLFVAVLAGAVFYGVARPSAVRPGTARQRPVADTAAKRGTIAHVEGTEFFIGLGLALDSTLTDSGVRTYRPANGLMRKRLTLRIRASDAGELRAVSLGLPVTELQRNVLLRMYLADFVAAIVPPADSATALPFSAQVKNDVEDAVDTGFLNRSKDDSLLPKRPSAAYLAMLGARESGTDKLGESLVSVSRLIEQADTAVVLSLLFNGSNVEPGKLSDWLDTRRIDMLGATQSDFEGNDFVTASELRLATRTVTQPKYSNKAFPGVLQVTLDTAARVTSLVFVIPEDHGIDASSHATALTHYLLAMVPRQDYAAMYQVRVSAIFNSDGPRAVDAARVMDFLQQATTSAVMDFTASSVRPTRTGTGAARMFVLAVGLPGSFTQSAARSPTPARRTSSP